MNLQRYRAADLGDLMDRITKNSIGMDTYFDKFFTETITNYPPYNLIQVNNSESRLEIALAGFKKEEVHVYTEYGKLFVEGKKKDKETGSEYFHQGLSKIFQTGHSQMILKSEMSRWKMDFLPLSWVR